MAISDSTRARFWAKVRKSDGCWEWTGATNSWGYGSFYFNRKTAKAHRVAYELEIGPIPNGLTLDHLCRNRGCVRPSHLEPVTIQVNLRRGDGMFVRRSCKGTCASGHEFTEANTIWRVRGGVRGRECRECKNASAREIRPGRCSHCRAADSQPHRQWCRVRVSVGV